MTTHFAFLHGGGQGSWVWEETIAALRQQSGSELGKVLALDVPGCGVKRDRDTSTVTVDAIADELLADLSSAHMERVVLVGHSQAGSILPLMAERQPQRFRRLVYVSCSSPRDGQTVIQMMGTGLHGSHPDEVGWPVDPRTASIAERYPQMFCNDMSAAETATFMSKLGRDNWPQPSYSASRWRYDHLEHIASTYVVCLQDGILPVEWQHRFAQQYGVQRTIRIDAGHQVMNTRPHTLAEVLRLEAR